MKNETTTQERQELSFDGCGINGPDEYRSRVATFTSTAMSHQYGPLFAAAPETKAQRDELLEALKALVTEIRAYSSPECDDEGAIGAPELKAADAAIARAEGRES